VVVSEDGCKSTTRCSIFFIDTFVSLAIPSLQLRLTTSLFSNLDSKLKTNIKSKKLIVSFVKLVLIDTELWPSQVLFNKKKNTAENRTPIPWSSKQYAVSYTNWTIQAAG
jgi:hypothetical protein